MYDVQETNSILALCTGMGKWQSLYGNSMLLNAHFHAFKSYV